MPDDIPEVTRRLFWQLCKVNHDYSFKSIILITVPGAKS
jgi:hypothetical protein